MKKKIFFILFSLHGLFSFSQTFDSIGGSIYDNQTIDYPIIVNGLPTSIDTSIFGLEQICLTISHTWDSDLTVSIIAPDGSEIVLFSGIGSDGDDFQNTCLLWNSNSSISGASAPFTGIFKPSGQYGLVNNGQDPNGSWYLRIKDGYTGDEGSLIEWALTFGNNPAAYFDFKESNLPIVLINTNGQSIHDEPKIIADMGIIYNGVGNRNHVSDTKNEYNGKISIEIRGNYSASLPQKPYAIELIDTNNQSIDSSLIDMPAEHDWLLIANYNDKSFSRNILPYHFFEQMGHYATRCRLVDVVLNNEYKGIYLLCEKIKRDSNRVDIAKLDSNEISGLNVTGGYIIKNDYWDNSNSWQLNYSPIGFPGLDIHLVYYYPKPENIAIEQKTYIQNFINSFESSLYGIDFKDSLLGFRNYIDTKSFIDYFLINELTRNVDGFKKSRFFNKNKDHIDGSYGKLKAGPVWDFDWSQKDIDWGTENGSGFNYNSPNQDVHATGWYIRLLEDSLFSNEIRCRYQNLRETIFSNTFIYSKIDSIANLVIESQNWHFQTWDNLGNSTGTPEVQAPSQSYAEEVQRLKDWYQRRLDWLDINLPGTMSGCSMANLKEIKEQNLDINIFPNPFTSTITIQFQQEIGKTYLIELSDQTGRIIKKNIVIGSQNNFNHFEFNNLKELTKGVYFVTVTIDEQKIMKKIVN
ncbi:MAG: CotH kinase family protein [Flavobacteriia bacterium]|nr:CotH kinase family protein [Flavobacteriia bacterium]